MTYSIPSSPPAKQPPAPVRVAVILLWASVALSLVNIALGFVPTPELDQAMEAFNQEHPELATNDPVTLVGNIIGIILLGASTVGLGVLAVFVGRGSQPARITTWVLGGILVLCQGCGVIGLALLPAVVNSLPDTGDANSEAAAEQARIVTENTPAWLTATSIAAMILLVIALIVVIILLAVPAANEFFRKEEEVWVPPTTPGAGGGFPQYPPPAIPQNPPAPPPAPPTQPPTPPSQS